VRSVALALSLAIVVPAPTFAGAKDETAAGWLPFPKWFSDWRDGLENKGLSFGTTWIVDNIGNPTGGMKRGFIDFGRLDLGVDADLEKLASLSGLKFHANMFAIYGQGLTHCCIGNLATISEIEALPDVRLYEAYFSITDEEQQIRFMMRIQDPLKQWKLSPMDVQARSRWEQYTKAKEAMLEHTHIQESPWWIVEAVDKKRARLNCISHLLGANPLLGLRPN
jgi:polyphosphate kinase 2 PPK2/carbohydrate-selective porin (OprB family)